MNKLKIVSLNVRGMRNDVKRRKIYKHMREQKPDICLLQETHATNNDCYIWSNQWGNKCLYANGDSNARGVSCLLTKNIVKGIKDVYRDIQGRYLILKIMIGEYSYCVANVYAPNYDCPSFFTEVYNIIKECDCTHSIIGGDFNLVLDSELDRSENTLYNRQAHETLSSIMMEDNLCDIWRLKHPTVKRFTWAKHRPKISWSRLDMFIVSQNISQKCTEATIESCILSDHNLITVEIDTDIPPCGPGIWKFNDELLKNAEFVENSKNLLRGIKKINHDVNPEEMIEMIQKEMTIYSQDCAKALRRKENVYKMNLYKLLSSLQNHMITSNEPDTNMLSDNVSRVKRELDSFETKQVKGTIFRCKGNYLKHGEVSSKYFFNLEKRNFISKTMYVMRREDGTLTKDYREILTAQHDFYSKLYTRDDTVKFQLNNQIGIRLSAEQQTVMDSPITKDELFDAVMTLKAGVTPGCDGFTVLFYRTFWKELVDPLFNLYNFAIQRGRLNRSARRGVINLIPKKSKDELLVKSWRPITLLSNCYKIFAKLVANRLQVTAQDLIGKQQTGFVPGRSLTSNVLKTMEILTQMNKRNKVGVLAIIDFEKCFDRISHAAIQGVFTYFGFGEYLIKIIMTLFEDISVCNLNNGYTSDFCPKTRGINQGCNASPLIYTYTG